MQELQLLRYRSKTKAFSGPFYSLFYGSGVSTW